MIKFDINQRIYKLVAASTSEDLDYTPPNGQTFVVVNAGGDTADSAGTNSCLIVWDPGGIEQEIILSTYRDAKIQDIGKIFTGDGARVLRILLTNDLNEATYIGGFWQGEILQ